MRRTGVEPPHRRSLPVRGDATAHQQDARPDRRGHRVTRAAPAAEPTTRVRPVRRSTACTASSSRPRTSPPKTYAVCPATAVAAYRTPWPRRPRGADRAARHQTRQDRRRRPGTVVAADDQRRAAVAAPRSGRSAWWAGGRRPARRAPDEPLHDVLLGGVATADDERDPAGETAGHIVDRHGQARCRALVPARRAMPDDAVRRQVAGDQPTGEQDRALARAGPGLAAAGEREGARAPVTPSRGAARTAALTWEPSRPRTRRPTVSAGVLVDAVRPHAATGGQQHGRDDQRRGDSAASPHRMFPVWPSE